MPARRILAFGGARPGGDVESLGTVVRAIGRGQPRIGLLATASFDDGATVEAFLQAARRLGARPAHLSWGDAGLEGRLLAQDAVFVAPGNTAYLVHQLRRAGADAALRTAWEAGVLLAGSSAGAILLFEHGVSRAVFDEVQITDGLGLLPGTVCPPTANRRAGTRCGTPSRAAWARDGASRTAWRSSSRATRRCA